MNSRWRLLVLPFLLSNAFDQPATQRPHMCPPRPLPPLPEMINVALGLCTHEKTHLYGTVFDAEETPVPYATVRFWGEEWDSLCRYRQGRGWEAQADSAGRYELTIPWGEGRLEINDPHYSHFPRHARFSIAPQAGRVPLDYRFHRFRVRALVTGPDGLPARPGSVSYYVYRGGGMCGTGIPNVNFTDGTFEIFLQDPEKFRFATRVDLPTGSATAWPDIWVGSDTTITIRIEGQPVEGVVRGYRGAPLAGAKVSARGSSAHATARTDSMGRYRIYVPSGKYQWWVEPLGKETATWFDTAHVFVQSPARMDLNLEFVELVGYVRNADSSQPLDSIRVCAYEDMGRGTAMTLTADQGRYRLFVRRGATISISATDTRLERILPSLRPKEPWDQLMRRYSRTLPVTLVGVRALADSTLDVVMQPVAPGSGN